MQLQRQDKAWETGSHPADRAESELDIRRILGLVRRRLLLIVTCGVVSTAIAVLVALQLAPRYRAETRIFFESDRLNVMQIDQVVNPGLRLEDQIQLILSENVLEGVIEDLRLLEHPDFNPEIDEKLELGTEVGWLLSRAVELVDQLQAFLGDYGPAAVEPKDAGPEEFSASEEQTGDDAVAMLADIQAFISELRSVPEAPEAGIDEAEAKRLHMVEIVHSLRKNLDVRVVTSRVLSISIATPNAELSAAVVNATAQRFILEQFSAKIEATRGATEWLSARTSELEEKVKDAEANVEEARAELSREAGQSSENTEAQVSLLNAALSERHARIPALEASYERAQNVLASGDFGSFSDFRGSPRLGALSESRTALEARQRSLRRTVPEGHPAMQRISEQLDVVDKAMQDEAQRITNALGNDLETARKAVDDLAADVRALETKSLEQSRGELRIRQLEREAQATRILYQTLLGRLQETAEEQKLDSSDARIIQRAEPATSPEGQKKRMVVAGGGVFGGAFGVGLAFLLEFCNTRFRHPQELEEETGYPVLGTLPAFGRLGRRDTLLNRMRTRQGRLLNESVRDLRTSILYSNIDAPPKIVMFTSAAPGDGKSTTSLLTALANQEMGRRTIVVECDLRRPSMYGHFRMGQRSHGLISVLTGHATLADAIFTDEESGLDLLVVPPREMMATRRNPADILSSQRFRVLLDELRESHDFIVLDAPPVLAVTDARVIAPLADAMVFVVKWNNTHHAAVREGIRQLERVKAPLIGYCMNAINEKQAKRFSNQHYGFYSGTYRDGYI